jgi:hypothetical protein
MLNGAGVRGSQLLKKTYFVLALVATSFSSALAQGPPCWDTVPPDTKYFGHHALTGDVGLFAPSDSELTHTLSVDGLNVSTKLTDGNSYLEVEITITNCSARTVQIDPTKFNLALLAPNADKNLSPLGPTRFIQFPNTGKTFPALVVQTIPYGRIGVFRAFFTRDGSAKSSDRMHSNYSLGLTVPVETWNFEFTFPRRKT